MLLCCLLLLLFKTLNFNINGYDTNVEYTPAVLACLENNVEILKLLLQNGADPNMFHLPNSVQATTMYIATQKENISMMKQLAEHNFDFDKFINNIRYEGGHESVFLQLCYNGNVECMDHLMYDCKLKNTIDIFQKDIDGRNGLYTAVSKENVSMVSYLLDKVYDTQEMRNKILDIMLSNLAASKSTHDGLSIFKLLKKEYKCPINKDTLEDAAAHSPLNFEFILNEEHTIPFVDFNYLTNELVVIILSNGGRLTIGQSIRIIVNYAVKISNTMQNNTYQQGMIDIFYRVMAYGKFEAFFAFVKELIKIFLNADDWKTFVNGELINKNVLNKILSKLNRDTDVYGINCDQLWRKLLQTMCDSYDNPQLLDQYDNYNDDDSESKNNNNGDDDKYDYYCDNNHLMIENTKDNDNYNGNNNHKQNKCILCSQLCDTMDYQCIECNECVCCNCNMEFKQLNQKLKMKQFEQFASKISKYDKSNKILQIVEL